MEGRVANLSADKQNLEDRVEKKKGELERNQKRLETLEAVRPPWMDDFKKTEVEVVRLYKVFESCSSEADGRYKDKGRLQGYISSVQLGRGNDASSA